MAKTAHFKKFWKLTTFRRFKLAWLWLIGSILLKKFFMTFWHQKRAFLAIFEVKNGLNRPLRSTGSTRENAQKSIFDHFSKCSKNRSKGQKMLKNTSFESYGIVLFENITYKSAKRHTEATALRKYLVALIKWRFFGFFHGLVGKIQKIAILPKPRGTYAEL